MPLLVRKFILQKWDSEVVLEAVQGIKQNGNDDSNHCPNSRFDKTRARIHQG